MKSKAIAWITGAAGLIGHNLVMTSRQLNLPWEVVGLTRSIVDLTDSTAVRSLFHCQPPQLIIHCAAISRLGDCQEYPHLARKINIEATALLAELAENIPFLFFSTDLVFDGARGNYVETDSLNPLHLYGETKAQAEQIVAQNEHHSILRTSINGGDSPANDRGFNHELRRAWQAGKCLKLFTDELRSPICAAVTARAVWELALKGIPGYYHISGSERLSRFQIGQLLAARWPRLQPKIESGSLRDYIGPPRAPDTSLNCAKIQSLLSFQLPSFSTWLAEQPQGSF